MAVEGSVSVHLASLAVEDIAPSSSHVHVVSQAAPEEVGPLSSVLMLFDLLPDYG